MRCVLSMVVVACLFAGCADEPAGQMVSLGDADPVAVMDTAREVLVMYGFTIESSDHQRMTLTTLPRPIDAGPERLVGASPARQKARLAVNRAEGNTSLVLVVNNQRQGSAVHSAMTATDSYSSVPNHTASEMESTPLEQYESWQNVGRDRELENSIIQDIRAKFPAETND